ncbi:MAG: beta galactosidase jelly roll domain-containing protein [Chitinispirillaceae bacterium]|nr:beta galactosidase jelly roll domain-containing protein [Chitinispirillaceae bacterium]
MKGTPAWVIIAIAVYILAFSNAAPADFHPHRIYKVRNKSSLNQGWKFINDLKSGSPQDATYNDASWQTVNVPHSAKYASPTNEAERATMPLVGNWSGISWYRKSFTLPSGAPVKKVFLEFEGAMSTAEVWLNGTRIGDHTAGGFTGFSFDATKAVNKTGANLLAVKLDCNYMADVPPGKLEVSGNEYPDFLLFSGIHRDVWLICTDNVYIPLYGQRISTPQVAAASAAVRVRTMVRNDSSGAVDAVVSYVIANDRDEVIAEKSGSATIQANDSSLFDITTETLSGITLWSPETPVLYRVFTRVSVNSRVVDDHVERFGIRKLDWKANDGFYLNDKRCLLKGVNMHNEFAWVGHALPDSRYFEELKLAKEMGANAVRCAHYPRDPAFYHACDELGLLCEPELPSWGGQTTSYPAAFWQRMITAAGEMVRVGYNHPSIIMWGIFNEAPLNNEFITNFRALHNAVKALDSTRFTSNINNKWYPPGSDEQNGATDIHGLNYNMPTENSSVKVYNAEYAEGWRRWCIRGATSSSENYYSEDDFSTLRWSGGAVLNSSMSDLGWTQLEANRRIAGAHMWVFVDYWSANAGLSHPMGVLDHYRIPKKVYYTFRTKWTGKADDYPVTGLTAAKVGLEADVTMLVADSTDLSRIVASIRDASGKCVWAAQNVTFQVTGPCNVFDNISTPRQTVAGKTGIILKSTNTPGTITVTASSGTLTSATITLTSAAPDISPLPFIWSSTGVSRSARKAFCGKSIVLHRTGETIAVLFPSRSAMPDDLSVVTMQGRKTTCPVTVRGTSVIIATRALSRGLYRLCLTKNHEQASKTIILIQ